MRLQFELKPYHSPAAARNDCECTSNAQGVKANSYAEGGQNAEPAQEGRLELVTRVLLQGADEPQAKPLQWILGKLLSDIALSPVSGQRETFTEWDPFSSTSVLYVDTTSGGSISGENGTIFSLC